MIRMYDIEIHCGEDYTQTLTIRDDDVNLMDLTGAEVYAQMRETSESNDYFEFDCTHNNDGGKILIRMSNVETEKIPFTRGVYDVILETPTEVTCLIYGHAEIIPTVTRKESTE